MKTFLESINEGKITLGKMNFSVHCFNDGKGVAIQFLPDSKTLDFSKNEQVEIILDNMKKNVPFLGDLIWYEINNTAAGLIFRINTFDLATKIEKSLK